MNRLVVFVVVAVLVAGAFLLAQAAGLLRPPPPPPPPDPTVRVVAALGRITPDGGILEVGADSSRRVARLLVEEGQTVKKDDVLAHLDNHDELAATVALYQAQLDAGKKQLQFRAALERANVAKAKAELRSIEELPPLDITMQELAIEKHRLELDLAQKEVKRLEKLVDKGSASREDLERKTTEVSQRTIQVKSSEAELRRLKAASTLDRNKAQAAVDAATANLQFQEASIDLDSLAKSLDQAKARLDGAMVRAPIDGTVLRIRTRPGEVVRNPGIATLGNLASMWVIAEVYENDILRVKPGQTVKVSSPALPEALAGKVLATSRLIARQAVFDLDPKAATDARVAEVRILLDRPETASRLVHLQVTTTIDVAEAESKSTTDEGAAP